MLRLIELPEALIGQAQIEVSFWTIGAKQSGEPQDLHRGILISRLEIEQSEVQEQLPVVEAEIDRILILRKLLLMLSHQAVSEPQVIVGERVVGMFLDHELMAADGFRIIFHSKKIVGQRITDFIRL